ncbi:hypothetical protein B9P52_11310 [Achromobacter denitrificans]|uniref:NAD-dependent epimerase/dehydratase family protein n=1 Tax=Achromobacter denitrificans TaxID=32002 RepID=UPI000B4DDC3A|nr:NAD-dependent epimerase/dehydratase family protein [Achromobacter denitrificans]ASC64857.1 hypothetical protein B9P52_11310 [Achromobacter denitrificans]
MRIAVTGASGYIGRALISLLQERGVDTLALVRGQPADPIPSGNHVWIANADLMSLDPDVLQGCDAIVHLAGRAHTRDTHANGINLFDQVNRQMATAVAQAARRAGVGRFVHVSTIGVHGTWSASNVMETSPLTGTSPYALSKIAAEEELLEVFHTAPDCLYIVRPPMVYGPDCPGNFSKLIKLVKTGLPLPFASVRAKRSFIHVRNLADFLADCSAGSIGAGTFVIADGSDFALPDLISGICSELRIPNRQVPFPPPVLRALGACIGRRQELDSLTRPFRVDWAKARTHGWTPALAVDTALRQALQETSR